VFQGILLSNQNFRLIKQLVKNKIQVKEIKIKIKSKVRENLLTESFLQKINFKIVLEVLKISRNYKVKTL